MVKFTPKERIAVKNKKEKKKARIGIWGKYSILLGITIVICFVINGILYIPMPSMANADTWLEFYGGLLGAAVGGIIALWGIEYTIKSTVMNVKPNIRPVRKDYFLYYNEKNGLFLTEKPFSHLMKEYAEENKVNLMDLEEYVIIAFIEKLANSKQGTKWEEIFRKLNIKKLSHTIKDSCEYRTYSEAMEVLYRELDKTYRNGVGRAIYEEIVDVFRRNISFEIVSKEMHKWGLFYNVYNTGAGNATDVRISWDFSKKYHLKICDALGFTKEEYEKMKHSFSLDDAETAEADVMLNENGENMCRVQIPEQLLMLIKNMYMKELKNGKEQKYENNNALVGEHEIAELNISCKDIYGENHNFPYTVYFRIMPTLNEEYGYTEERFYLKFENRK